MEVFNDAKGATIRLSFSRHSFKQEPKHVLVICKKGNGWLLTKHKKRGLEFPGGKAEYGETIEMAAIREVWEETGGHLAMLDFIGEYEVSEKDAAFVKAIFYGEMKEMEEKADYLETAGPVLIDGDILTLRWGQEYSFIMKDQVVEKALLEIEKRHG
jgi:8-oxo-dGTP diphosphatase